MKIFEIASAWGSRQKSLLINYIQVVGGATAIEYALVASLIAVIILASLSALGTSVKSLYTSIASAV